MRQKDSRQKSRKFIDKTHPSLTDEWDHAKNEGHTPDHIRASSGRPVWWICPKPECGRSYDLPPNWRTRRNGGQNCPYCAGKRIDARNCLATLNPELTSESHKSKNGVSNLTDVAPNYSKKVWWKCRDRRCSNEWQATPNKRMAGRGCPKCRTMKSTFEFRLNVELQPHFPDILSGSTLHGYEIDRGIHQARFRRVMHRR